MEKDPNASIQDAIILEPHAGSRADMRKGGPVRAIRAQPHSPSKELILIMANKLYLSSGTSTEVLFLRMLWRDMRAQD